VSVWGLLLLYYEGRVFSEFGWGTRQKGSTAELAETAEEDLKPGIAFPDNLAIIREALRDIATKLRLFG
jgi:hypothetical protein